MKKISDELYFNKLYAGWLGKTIGVRHGANIEGWTYERILNSYGEIDSYIRDFKNFAADDDTNGPLFFLKALADYPLKEKLTAKEIGYTWLNYVPDNHSFFWWGGYGVSSEHTAYYNLKNGIEAPRSGSIEQNGTTIAEQIGGQIFIDTWGMICPGNPHLAAQFANKAASVSHDGNGIYGGQFIAACVALAFVENDIELIIQKALQEIPSDCEYARVTNKVFEFYKKTPSDWRACFQYIKCHFGYDKYPGNCHIIPNSSVMILAMLYGQGDYSETINICNMCGWDTDCNVGNVGAVLGTMVGLTGIDEKWTTPINDFICFSSVIGAENISDLAYCTQFTAKIAYDIAGEVPTNKHLADLINNELPRYNFELPQSTHAFRMRNVQKNHTRDMTISNTASRSHTGSRSLKLIVEAAKGGELYQLYQKNYYYPADFDDNRYKPSFSPIIYPGQTVEAIVMGSEHNKFNSKARLFIRLSNTEILYSPWDDQISGSWGKLAYTIPKLSNILVEEVGVEFTATNDEIGEGVYFLDSMNYSGTPNYAIDFSKHTVEKWAFDQEEVSQFTYLRGIWDIEAGQLHGSYGYEPAETYTGNVEWQDYTYTTSLIPKLGSHHRVLFRVQGAVRSYILELSEGGLAKLIKKTPMSEEQIESIAFDWQENTCYDIMICTDGAKITIYIQDQKVFEWEDKNNPYLTGMVGFGNSKASHTAFSRFSIASSR